jgi:tRNA 2-selenouridine synthase
MTPTIVSAEFLLDAVPKSLEPLAVQRPIIVDVRSPCEFATDHVPSAINLPVLDDEQRHRVGTLYAQDRFEAKKLGAALVSKNIAMHLEGPIHAWKKSDQVLVYCWRGGQRSQSLGHVLAQVGLTVQILDGGYRAYRRALVKGLAELVAQFQWRVVCGMTGCGKTRLLKALAGQGRQVLDLEAIACHRGSLLGLGPGKEQPSQKLFESTLWHALHGLNPERPVYVESESRKIGQVQVPDALITAMRASECLELRATDDDRVRLLIEEYAHFLHDPQALSTQLKKLVSHHGHERIRAWLDKVEAGQWQAFVRAILTEHYDPSYTSSIHRNFPRLSEAKALVLPGIGLQDYESLAASLSG